MREKYYEDNIRYLKSPVLIRAEMRRKKEHYRRIFKFIVAFILIMTIAVGVLSVRSFAGSKAFLEDRAKYYKSIEIEKGDTLNSIAATYISDEYCSKNEYISEVVKINHLTDIDNINAGSHLIIPYYAAR